MGRLGDVTQVSNPAVARVLLRAVRERCPACGQGRVFATWIARNDVCPACGWRLERCEGHWIGGSEVTMFVTYPVAMLPFLAWGLAFGVTPWTALAGALFTIPVTLAVHRRSRCLFYAVDYLLDPAPDDPPDAGSDERLLRDAPGGPPPPPPAYRAVAFLPRPGRPPVPGDAR